MKKNDFAKLAFMGMASGLLLQGQVQGSTGNANNAIEYPSDEMLAQLRQDSKNLVRNLAFDSESANLLASRSNCKTPKGCPSLVADRDVKNSGLKDPGKVASNPPSQSSKSPESSDKNNENLGYHLMTEDELLLELNDEGTKLYNSLSPQGKELARKVASQRCNGTNDCKGLNACQTDDNKCAGKGACKGKSKCAFSDKNLAVKVVSEKMAQKRQNTLNGK